MKCYYDYARMAVSRLPVQGPWERDDLLQEAALAVFLNGGKVESTRSEREQDGYRVRVAKSKAVDVYRHTRTKKAQGMEEVGVVSEEAARDGEGGRKTSGQQIRDPFGYLNDHQTPEQILMAKQLGPKVFKALALGYSRLTDQEKALMRARFGREPMREDLVRMGRDKRTVSFHAREKIFKAAQELGVEELTREMLLAAFWRDPK